MDEHQGTDPAAPPVSGSVTRLGPDSGGRASGDSDVRVDSWEWGTGRPGDQVRRPGLPWIGVFLLVLGGLLLIQTVFPQSQAMGSVLFLAVGLAFLIRWAVTRGTGSLYAGAIITALAVPGALTNAGLSRDGLGVRSASGSHSCSSRWSAPGAVAASAGRPGSVVCWR